MLDERRTPTCSEPHLTTPTGGASPNAGLLVRVTRGSADESFHHVHAVALAADGTVQRAWGEPDAFIYPRSSAKPVQALAMVRAGLSLPPRLLALVCSSHSAESFHRAAVAEILATVGLGLDALQNTPAYPIGEDSYLEWIRSGAPQAAVAQDCSGKHSGMIVTCVLNGWPIEHYLNFDHPLQQHIRATWEEFFGSATEPTRDGCGAPLFGCSTTGLARGYRQLMTSSDAECQLIREAMAQYPQMVGGTKRFVTDLMQCTPGLIAKDGAEAILAFAYPDGRAGALKVLDGSKRAVAPAAGALLKALGFTDLDAVGHHIHAATFGHGKPIGVITAID